MPIKVVDKIDVVSMSSIEVQAIVTDEGSMMLFQDDYCESGGVCYSRVDLTRRDLEMLLELLTVRTR
jgi:hypothetical protein